MTDFERRPLLRIVRGTPTDEELAALATVLATVPDTAAGTGTPVAGPPPARSRWADRAALVRAPLAPGPGAWRASALPR